MNKSYLKKLFRKYNAGTASEEECNYLFSCYNLFETAPDGLTLLSEDQRQELKARIKKDIWSEIEHLKSKNHQPRLFKHWMIKMAAAAVIIGICVTCLYIIHLPESVFKTYTTSKIKRNRFICLPDGSMVIVNAGSKIDYPSSFAGQTSREVYLEGQAYFDIKHDPGKPFVIHTGKLETTVLGTAFNIKAWQEDSEVSITVVRGKVKVKDTKEEFGVLVPKQQLIYHKKNASVTQHTVNPDPYLTWKAEDLLFDNVTFAEAAKVLEDRFQVHIQFKDKTIGSKPFTTTFLKSETLEQVLNSICEFNNAVYENDKRISVITIRHKSK